MTQAPKDPPNVLALFYDTLPAVQAIAADLRRQARTTLSFDEVLSFGHEGLLRAARRFDPQRGTPFQWWATLRVTWTILDGVRAHAPGPVCASPVVEELEAPDLSPEDAVARFEVLDAIRDAVSRLPERERALFVRHYFDDAKLTLASREVGVSKAWGSRVLARAAAAVARDLRRRGIRAP